MTARMTIYMVREAMVWIQTYVIGRHYILSYILSTNRLCVTLRYKPISLLLTIYLCIHQAPTDNICYRAMIPLILVSDSTIYWMLNDCKSVNIYGEEWWYGYKPISFVVTIFCHLC